MHPAIKAGWFKEFNMAIQSTSSCWSNNDFSHNENFRKFKCKPESHPEGSPSTRHKLCPFETMKFVTEI